MKISGLRSLVLITLLSLGGMITSALFAYSESIDTSPIKQTEELISIDTLRNNLADSVLIKNVLSIMLLDSVGENEDDRYTHLTEYDFQLVAKELDVEVAAIKAVVEIEAGKAMRGFWAPGIPVINFDHKMYNKYKNRAESKAGAKGEKVPEGLTGRGLKAWTALINARKQNAQGANMGTFWGMFQIGGFHYKKCGCASVDEFVKRMAYSELEQLQLFAIFITESGMVNSLKKKDWSAFARRYNGPSYARRGYHTKIAKAYLKYSKEQQK